jgi:hypothetical protein
LTADPDDLIFNFDELDEWRKTFEGKVEEKANISEGMSVWALSVERSTLVPFYLI